MAFRVRASTLPLTPSSDAQKTDLEKRDEEEAQILAAIASRKKLASDLELAQGVQYTEPLKTSYALLILRRITTSSHLIIQMATTTLHS